MTWNTTHAKKQGDTADARAREVGPPLMELRARGLSVTEILEELNRRGFRSATGKPLTPDALQRIRARWLAINRRGGKLT